MIWQGPGMGALLYVTEGKRMREPVTDGERGICAPRAASKRLDPLRGTLCLFVRVICPLGKRASCAAHRVIDRSLRFTFNS